MTDMWPVLVAVVVLAVLVWWLTRPRAVPTGPEVVINPGDNIQAALNANPTGTAFRLKAGVHRITTNLTPKNDQQLLGESGSILSGGRVVTGFADQGGNIWRAGGQTDTPITDASNLCCPDRPRGHYTNDLFLDHVQQIHVASRAEVKAGAWFYDYDADCIYVYSTTNPNGRLVEVSVCPHAVNSNSNNLRIEGLVIELFASRFQQGALQGGGQNWIVTKNAICRNHMAAARHNSGWKITYNDLSYNGQMALGGGGTDVEIGYNRISYNNTNHVQIGNEAGGLKACGTVRVWIHHNDCHHNMGPGLWGDINNDGGILEDNHSYDNYSSYPYEEACAPGIFWEISRGAIIRRNRVERNGLNFASWLWGSGILIAASGKDATGQYEVDVSENVLVDNGDGIGLIQQNRHETGGHYTGPYYLHRVRVHHNTVYQKTGQSGCVCDTGSTGCYDNEQNTFFENTYYTDSSHPFAWKGGDRTFAEWQAYGLDTAGKVLPWQPYEPVVPPEPIPPVEGDKPTTPVLRQSLETGLAHVVLLYEGKGNPADLIGGKAGTLAGQAFWDIDDNLDTCIDLTAAAAAIDFGDNGLAAGNGDLAIFFACRTPANVIDRFRTWGAIAGAATDTYHWSTARNSGEWTLTLSGVVDVGSGMLAKPSHLYSLGICVERGKRVRFSIFDHTENRRELVTKTVTATPNKIAGHSRLGNNRTGAAQGADAESGGGWLGFTYLWGRPGGLSDEALLLLHRDWYALFASEAARRTPAA